LRNELRRRNIDRDVAAVVTQVVVDVDDPSFAEPSKPVGPFYTEEDVRGHAAAEGWEVREDAGRGWRRVVPSPRPLAIVEERALRALLAEEVVVIAAGGGGIPVVRRQDGTLRPCDAVIDKDYTSALLADRLGAATLILATGVEKVCLGFGTPAEKTVDRMTAAEAETYRQQGEFAPGSMLPKIEAALQFIANGERRVIITRPDLIEAAIDGKTGTHIVP
jgi:carbamate kinase